MELFEWRKPNPKVPLYDGHYSYMEIAGHIALVCPACSIAEVSEKAWQVYHICEDMR